MPNLIPVSLSLWAGLYNVLFAMRVGAPVVVMDGFEPVELAVLVERFGIRSTVLPPAAMTALVDDERVTDLAPLRYVRSITAPLSPLQARRFRDKFGISVLNSYGQTEIGGEIVGWSAADSRAHGDDKLGSVGRPHAGVELRLDTEARTVPAGDTGTDAAAAGRSGELQVRTPAIAAGYADGSDLGDRLTEDGWFRTGDIARIDQDGFVWIEGRVSDMINRGGMKVFPAEVEEVLRTSPEVSDAAVIAVPDDRLGEVPVAFVVAAAGVAPSSDGLSDYCRAHLAPYKVPVRFEVIDALPRNEVGKVLKTVLKGSHS
jgi:acyl-CoA synthetase (AMP-forming)/AMP-acid ligase II